MSWSGIEVVITGLTRNQFAFTGTWVRIPPAPPNKAISQEVVFLMKTKKRAHRLANYLFTAS